MRRRFKPANCLVVSLFVVFSILMLVPCGLVASVNLSGNDVLVNAPFVGAFVTKTSPQPAPARQGIIMNIGTANCLYGFPNSPHITIGNTWITFLDCNP